MGGESVLSSTRRKIVLGLLLIVLIGLGVFAWQAITASRALLDARDRAEDVRSLISAGDFQGASAELQKLRDDTHKAHDATGGILWDIGKHVPLVGRNIGAVQTVSQVLDTATKENAPVALDLSKAVDEGRFRPRDGQIDLAEVERFTPAVQRAARAIQDAGEELDEVNADKLLFPFNDLVGDLQDEVDDARSAASSTATAFELLPEMLGRTEPRDYLLVIQNPAELRSAGGLPGSVALLHATKGKLTMGWQGSAADLNRVKGPAVTLSKETSQQYGNSMASDFRDFNFTPDFPEAAQIAKAMAERELDVEIDGVVTVDPVALGLMMVGTGPVTVGSGVTLNATTVVPTLLNRAYQLLPDQFAQDAFFEDTARKVFDAVMSGRGDQEQAIKGLAEGARQHRVLLWSADPEEQAAFRGSAISGDLAGVDRRTPEVGMYINDTTASKKDFYLHYRASASAVSCRNDDRQDIRASMSFTSTLPKDTSSLSIWVTGTEDFAPKGVIAFNLRVYAPVGGEITGLAVNGETRSITADKHRGRQVAFIPLALEPGQKVTLTADIRTAKGQDGDGIFSFTPGVLVAPNGVEIDSACD